ncbi:MAG: serine protease [Desulfobacteraceae bacterium]|nr:MAG: serine protease [Desulfobacteraceae bacterium]
MKNIAIKSLIVVFLLSVCQLNPGKAIAEENQLKDLIKLVMPATVLVMTYDAKGKPLAQGSGFFVSETGELITNHHVFKNAESIEIKCPDNSVYKITLVIAEDLTSDLVKLQADTGGKKVPWLQLNKAKIEVGEKIVVIGSPKGLEATVSDGIVSAVRDVPGFGNIIQITAPISPGSSGSAVVNMKGEVIGVASSQMLEGQNLNFVVPAEKIMMLKEKKRTFATNESKEVETQSDDIYSAALIYYFKEDYKKALPLFEQYLLKNRNDANVWFYLGVCNGGLSRYQEAIDAYKQSIKLKPDNAEVHYNLGVAYYNFGHYQEAIEMYMQAIKLRSDFAVAHSNLGAVYYKLGRYQEAIEAYKQGCDLNDASAFYNLGLLYLNLNRHQEAIALNKQAIKLKQDYVDAYNNLGSAYTGVGRYQDAIEAYKEAIKLKPDYANAHYNIGIAYLKIGDKENALKEYKILKAMNPIWAVLANNLFNEINK